MGSISVHHVVVDGRTVRAFTLGPVDADAVVFHTGTPSPPVRWDLLEHAVVDQGLRLVTYQRPGYEGSDRHPGRRVGDAVHDVEAILNELGVEAFVTVGWSGGGQHALACAALLPGRCRAAATIGTLSAYDPADESWWDAMTPPNEEAFRAAIVGEDSLRRHLEPGRERFLTVTADELSEALGELVSAVDKSALTSELADMLARSRRQAAATGFDGWIDDFLAFVRPWGFELTSTKTPVTIWHGHEDRFVPIVHAHRLTSQIPAATSKLLAGEGHLSLATSRLQEVLTNVTTRLTTDVR